MPGDLDVYQPCPCGSGKKIKFCCHAIIADMLKVSELQETRQHQPALTLLATVEKKVGAREVWSRAWVKTTKAFLIFGLGKIEEARQLVGEVLGELPEHPLAAAVEGLLALSADGYPSAMRSLYRAFRLSAESQPVLTSHLAVGLADFLMLKGHILAARQHLALAVQFDAENEDALGRLNEFLRDARLPWILRDSYVLTPPAGLDHLKTQFDQAVLIAKQGCFSDAAKAFGMLARQEPKHPGLWWNIALCHAWAGEDPLAVEALKASAANQPDFELAVDCLALARQLRPANPETRVPKLSAVYKVESVSKLLTLLDQKPEFHRLEIPENVAANENRPAAIYQILDRDPGLVPLDTLTAENVPRSLGDLAVFDRRGDERPARAGITAFGRDRLSGLTAAFTAVAGPLVTAEGEPREHGALRAEYVPLIPDWSLPSELPPSRANELHRGCQQRILKEIWPATPQEALGGKTPVEAAALPELKSAVAAAVVDLDVFCECNNMSIDEAEVRSRLGLPPVAQTAPNGDNLAEATSLLRLRHTALARLTDEQLAFAADYVMRLGHSTLCSTVISEVVNRPSLHDKANISRLCLFLSQVCNKRHEFEAALGWVVRGKQECKAHKAPLDELAVWELQELLLRTQHPDDPAIIELANTLWNYYVPKLPALREQLIGILTELSLPGPWNASAIPVGAAEPLAAAAAGSSALWTPETQTAGQPSKLWLPGQE